MPPPHRTLVLVGSYAAAGEPGIHAFEFDEATGALAECGSFSGIANPAYLVVHPHRPWMYSVSETGGTAEAPSGEVWACRFEREPLRLEPSRRYSSGGTAPCHLLLAAAGRWLVVSNYGSGSVGLFPIHPDGSLGEMADFVQHQGSGPNAARQEGPHAHSASLTPDGRYVIVADLGLDQLLIYRLDPDAGKLRLHRIAQAAPGAGPRHMAFHRSGRHLYVANELDSTLSLFDYDTQSGSLRERHSLPCLPPGAPENLVADIHVSATRPHVYVSNRGHDSLAAFETGEDGSLKRLAIQPCGGQWPRNFALAPAGRFVLVANQNSGEVSVLTLTGAADVFGPKVAAAPVPQPACVRLVGQND